MTFTEDELKAIKVALFYCLEEAFAQNQWPLHLIERLEELFETDDADDMQTDTDGFYGLSALLRLTGNEPQKRKELEAIYAELRSN